MFQRFLDNAVCCLVACAFVLWVVLLIAFGDDRGPLSDRSKD